MRLHLVLLLAAAACASPAVKSEIIPPWADLTGVWTAVLQSGASRTEGIVALFQSSILADSFGFELAPGVTQGTYDIDFEPLGFKLVGGAALQPATSTLQGDSVEVVLNPYVGHGRVALVGLHTGGIVAGEWTYDGPGGARGMFEFRKVP